MMDACLVEDRGGSAVRQQHVGEIVAAGGGGVVQGRISMEVLPVDVCAEWAGGFGTKALLLSHDPWARPSIQPAAHTGRVVQQVLNTVAAAVLDGDVQARAFFHLLAARYQS
jgi:hypothetical protein